LYYRLMPGMQGKRKRQGGKAIVGKAGGEKAKEQSYGYEVAPGRGTKIAVSEKKQQMFKVRIPERNHRDWVEFQGRWV